MENRNDKHRKMNLFRFNVITLIYAVLAGCSYFVTWDETVIGGVGRPMNDLQKRWGAPNEIRNLRNGNKEYKYWLKKIDQTCIHYWIVDSNGIIKDYRYQGRCRPIG